MTTQNQIGVWPIGSGGGMPALVDTQAFTTSGTWTKPGSGNFCDILLIGGGGGGASGERNATSTTRSGGDGGSAGNIVLIKYVPISYLSATESITIGAGGAGGAGITVDSTNGTSGSAGSSTTIKSYSASGGSGGQQGSSSSAGTTGNNSDYLKGEYYSEILFGPSYSEEDQAGVNSFQAPRSIGGQGGGTISSSNTAANSFTATRRFLFSSVTYVMTPATPGANGTEIFTYFGGGGAGGLSTSAGTTTSNGGDGINGGGGGGGAASTNGTLSGAGGNGGNGVCVVRTYS